MVNALTWTWSQFHSVARPSGSRDAEEDERAGAKASARSLHGDQRKGCL